MGNICCAEAYLRSSWTTNLDATRAESIDVWAATGVVDVEIEYHAVSSWCGGDARFQAEDAEGGWVTIAGQDGAWCQ